MSQLGQPSVGDHSIAGTLDHAITEKKEKKTSMSHRSPLTTLRYFTLTQLVTQAISSSDLFAQTILLGILLAVVNSY